MGFADEPEKTHLFQHENQSVHSYNFSTTGALRRLLRIIPAGREPSQGLPRLQLVLLLDREAAVILTPDECSLSDYHPLANSFILCYCYPKNKPRMTPPEKTVLIIEDEADAAELFAEMMRVSGFRVLKTSSSIPAIAMMTAEKPDIILLDIMMPDVSGLDILRQMRRDPMLANIPVIVVTAKSMPSDIKNGMEAGASTYLTKPVGYLELKEAVERTLANNTPANKPSAT